MRNTPVGPKFFQRGLILATALISICLPVSSFGAFQISKYKVSDGLSLRYVVAVPLLDKKTQYPIWIFQPGDGNIVDAFEPEQYRQMMEAFSGHFQVALVMPELRRQLYVNDLKTYCELDFFHRVSDLSKLIDSAKKAPYVDSSKIVLFGHSAGGEIVTLAAFGRKDVWGVATYGTGVVSDGESGRLTPVDEKHLHNDCTDPKDYKERSGTFWRQLFIETQLFSSIQKLKIPYIAMFGGNDSVTPLDSEQKNYGLKLREIKANFSQEIFPGLDHGGYAQGFSVFDRVKAWSK